MFEWDDAETQDESSSLEYVVARTRTTPVAAQRAIRLAHAHGLRDLLARERRVQPAREAPDAPLDAVA